MSNGTLLTILADECHGIPEEGGPAGGVREGGEGLGGEPDAERHRDTARWGYAHAGEVVITQSQKFSIVFIASSRES